MLTPAQIEARYEGIGASEAASAANLPSAYMTARELYHVKRREVEPRENDPLLSFMGHAVEEPLAEWYARETGRRVQRVNATQVHADLPWMICHPDRRCVGNRVRRGLEIKQRVHADGWGPPGTDQVADEVLLQVQHQMAVMDWPVCDVICYFAGRDVRIYTVPRDEALIDALIDVEGELWHRIQVGDPPDHDYEHHATLALIQQLHPATDGKVMQLPGEIESWHEVLQEAEAKRKRYDTLVKAAKAHIMDLMGDAAIGQMPSGGEYRRAQRHNTWWTSAGEQRSTYIALTYHKPRTTR